MVIIQTDNPSAAGPIEKLLPHEGGERFQVRKVKCKRAPLDGKDVVSLSPVKGQSNMSGITSRREFITTFMHTSFRR